jgi:phenylacetate-CoA ligase
VRSSWGQKLELLNNAYGSLVRRAVFPLQELCKGHRTLRMIREMKAAETMPLADLRQLQQQRLEALLRHAFETVAYYRDWFHKSGLQPADIRTVSDLGRLPFLTKDVIRKNLDRLKSSQAVRVQRMATGGSTGKPLIFYLGPTRVSSDVAARCRAEGWWGLGMGDQEFVFWGSPIELQRQDRIRQLRDRVFRTQLCSAFEMSPAVMTRFLDEMERRGCRKVFGYPSSIALLCQHARKEGRDLRKLGVRAAFVTAEYLWDHWRQIISQTFGCPVANGYGGRDSGFIAHECPAGGMHITADRILVEIVDEQGRPLPPGHSGEIVITHLDTPEMPFIRYRTGDVGTLSSAACPCGRTLPLLERVEGRKTDFVLAPDGRTLHGLSLIYVLREIEGIEQFRITQKALDRFEVEIVAGTGFDRGSERKIRDGFSQRLRHPVKVNVTYPAAIAPSASGKFRYVVSEVISAGGLTPSAPEVTVH